MNKRTYTVVETLPDGRERIILSGVTYAEAFRLHPAKWAVSIRADYSHA